MFSDRSETLRAAVLTLMVLLCGQPAMAAEEEKEEARQERQQKLEQAQKRLETAAREVADLSMSISGEMMPRVMALRGRQAQRAMLGVAIGTRGEGAERSDGVEILSVSPGGPAEAAGLKAGDVITEVNGKALKGDDKDSPREKLLDVVEELKAGDKVAVSYRRDGKGATASIVAQPLADRVFSVRVPGPGMPGLANFPNVAFSRADGVFGSAELVALTPKLGQYFGTDKGLLVVRAPSDSRLQIEEGDVILDIDGRTPSSPTHALRILGSYQPGEKLKFNVLRMKKRVSFDVTVPNEVQRGMRRSRIIQYPADTLDVAPFMQALPAPAPVPVIEPFLHDAV